MNMIFASVSECQCGCMLSSLQRPARPGAHRGGVCCGLKLAHVQGMNWWDFNGHLGGCKRQLCVERCHRDLSQSACTSDGGKSGRARERERWPLTFICRALHWIPSPLLLAWGQHRTILACFNACCFTPLEASCSFWLKCVRLNRLTSYPGWVVEGGGGYELPPLYTRAVMSGHSNPGRETEVTLDCTTAVKRTHPNHKAFKSTRRWKIEQRLI